MARRLGADCSKPVDGVGYAKGKNDTLPSRAQPCTALDGDVTYPHRTSSHTTARASAGEAARIRHPIAFSLERRPLV